MIRTLEDALSLSRVFCSFYYAEHSLIGYLKFCLVSVYKALNYPSGTTRPATRVPKQSPQREIKSLVISDDNMRTVTRSFTQAKLAQIVPRISRKPRKPRQPRQPRQPRRRSARLRRSRCHIRRQYDFRSRLIPAP